MFFVTVSPSGASSLPPSFAIGHAAGSPPEKQFARAIQLVDRRPRTFNLPLFGKRRLRNLYLNTGHGHIGWTMSHGSAKITADLIAGRAPEIPMDGLLP